MLIRCIENFYFKILEKWELTKYFFLSFYSLSHLKLEYSSKLTTKDPSLEMRTLSVEFHTWNLRIVFQICIVLSFTTLMNLGMPSSMMTWPWVWIFLGFYQTFFAKTLTLSLTLDTQSTYASTSYNRWCHKKLHHFFNENLLFSYPLH